MTEKTDLCLEYAEQYTPGTLFDFQSFTAYSILAISVSRSWDAGANIHLPSPPPCTLQPAIGLGWLDGLTGLAELAGWLDCLAELAGLAGLACWLDGLAELAGLAGQLGWTGWTGWAGWLGWAEWAAWAVWADWPA